MAPARSVTRLALGCVRRFATPDMFQTIRHAGWRAAAAAESLCSIQISRLLSWRKSFWLRSMPAQPTEPHEQKQVGTVFVPLCQILRDGNLTRAIPTKTK